MPDRPFLYCDLTQSWSEKGGGVGTYLRHKRARILERTPHRHLLIIPGARDEVVEEGRAITAYVRSPHVPRNPNYRLLLRNRAVKRVLERFRPDFIECQDSYNLPWAALSHRERYPETVLVGGYCTDFPTAYVRRFGRPWVGDRIAAAAQELSYNYCGRLYRRFDGIYALSDSGGGERLRRETKREVDILPFGIELDLFTSAERDEALRAQFGANGGPLLVYAGRVDEEKRAPEVFEAFRRLPKSLGATLIMVGEGKERQRLMEEAAGLRAHFPGFVRERERLAKLLASADIYVSAMADETFGVSVVEAQAAGLPVVGVAGGAMIERVPPELGILGPIGDPAAMAENIRHIWGNGATAMGARAREHVRTRFSWGRSFDILFDEIYPKAQAHRQSLLRP
jgi:alpha-1,6-mannosyltransferase